MFRAANLFNNNEKLRSQASGSFVSNRTPPSFNRPESHPVMKVIKDDLDTRKHQLVTSSKTDAILAIYRSRVVTLNVPHIGYDHLDDEDENFPLITGALGLEVATAYPAYFPLKEATSDLFYLGRQEDATFFSGVKLPAACFKGAQDTPVDVLDKPFDDEDIYSIRFPLTLPLLKGIDILEGSLSDPNVIEALDDYHVAVGAWARIMKTVLNDRSRLVHPDIMQGFGTNCFVPEPISVHLAADPKVAIAMIPNDSADDEDSLWCTTNNRIKQVREANIQRFLRQNSEKFPQSVSVPDKPAPKAAEEEKTLLNGKHSRAVVDFMLALASVNEDEMTVTVPDLSQDFVECFQWDTMELICRTYKSCMQDFMSDRQEHTRDFFYRRINGPLWSSAILALYLKGIWHDHGLDDNRHNLSHSISVLNFLADPPTSDNAECLDYLKKSHLEDLEALVEEATEKRQKIGLKVFLGGKQDTPEDIITCLANMDAHFAFIVNFDDKPEKGKPCFVF